MIVTDATAMDLARNVIQVTSDILTPTSPDVSASKVTSISRSSHATDALRAVLNAHQQLTAHHVFNTTISALTTCATQPAQPDIMLTS